MRWGTAVEAAPVLAKDRGALLFVGEPEVPLPALSAEHPEESLGDAG
jgi:hypothetical protein